MRQQNALFDHEIAHVINPDRHAVFEPEFAQIFGAVQIELAAGALFRA